MSRNRSKIRLAMREQPLAFGLLVLTVVVAPLNLAAVCAPVAPPCHACCQMMQGQCGSDCTLTSQNHLNPNSRLSMVAPKSGDPAARSRLESNPMLSALVIPLMDLGRSLIRVNGALFSPPLGPLTRTCLLRI